jgi:hypothetical protein
MTLAWDSATVAVAVTLVGRQVLAAMQLPAAAWPPPDHQSTLWQSQLQASLILTLLALGNCIGDYSWSALSTAALWVRLLARACGGFLRKRRKTVQAQLTTSSHSFNFPDSRLSLCTTEPTNRVHPQLPHLSLVPGQTRPPPPMPAYGFLAPLTTGHCASRGC